MTVETLSPGAAAIVLSSDELLRCTDRARLCSLVRQAQSARGLPVWKSMDTRTFLYGAQALLLAWPTEVLLFSFPDFEALLQGALRCPEDTPSALICTENVWYLLLRCPPGRVPGVLYEYGTPEEAPEGLLSHLREHGDVSLSLDAVSVLQARIGKL